MKDLVISKGRIKKELIIWAGCMCIAFLTNVYAIIKYEAGWGELFSQLNVVIILSIPFYVLGIVIRMIHVAYKRIIKRSRA
jgi:hypothetical protein